LLTQHEAPLNLGCLQLHSLSDGFFGLDGGAMFGVVPKPLWERKNPPDERNRIRLASRPLLVVTGDERILIDTGIGDKWDTRQRDIYRIEKTDTIDASLRRAGFAPEDITRVILTHLHFDHAGATTRLDVGLPVPRFPRARHYVQRREWEIAINLNRRTRGSYIPDDYLPVDNAGLLELLDGDTELVPGVRLVRTGGHTAGHQVVRLESAGSTAVYWSDLIPTRTHVAVPYIMGYDSLPLETMEQKERLLARASAEEWLCFFPHDPDYAAGFVRSEGEDYTITPVPA